MKMTQCDKILMIMLKNKWKAVWDARDFQNNDTWFIGYEASARMSELKSQLPNLFKVGRDGRFRTLSINWENETAVNDALKYISLFERVML